MTRNQKLNLYNEASAFYELAECGRKYIPEQKNVESYIPYIVNMTFCAELLLKLLLIEEGKSIDDVKKLKHNLKKLYCELRIETKERIYSSFKKPLIYNIQDELERSKHAFVQWRYLVLDKAKKGVDENTKNNRKIPLEEWLKLEPHEREKFAQNRSGSMQVAPFFLKEFNEVLMEICKYQS